MSSAATEEPDAGPAPADLVTSVADTRGAWSSAVAGPRPSDRTGDAGSRGRRPSLDDAGSTSAAHGSPRRSPTTARDLAERPAGANGVARGPSGEVEPTDDDLEQAARQLLDLARRLPRPRVKDAVLVDVVLDGARCVVTCSGDPRAAAGAPAAVGAATALSPREQEIARMVATGCTNKEIASVLEISSWTVSTHLRRIFGKLDVSTRAAMVARLVLSDGRP